MKDFRNNKTILAIVGLAAVAVFAFGILNNQTFLATASPQVQSQMGEGKPEGLQTTEEDSASWIYKANKRYHDYSDGVLKVRAGVGSHVAPLTWFFPQNAEIKVGETVVWYNPTKVQEPHTVSFMKDPRSYAPLDVPFVLVNGTGLVPLDPQVNSDPIMVPGPNGTTLAIVANARAYQPVAVTDGNAEYLDANANYTMTGNEGYVNSGFIWPQGQTPPGLQVIESFSVTFEKAGTYDYLCVIHPWMTGRVAVS